MMNYYIKIECPQGKLSAAEKDVLKVAKSFDGCFIHESSINSLRAYFKNFLDNFLETKPKSKKVILTEWSSFMDYKCMHIGKICIELKGLKDMPDDFNKFCNERKSPLLNRIVWVRNPYTFGPYASDECYND